MSRPVRDLTIEDLGDLKAVSSYTDNGKVYWNVTCSYGSAHVFSAEELTRKRYPKRSCGTCGKQGYIDEAVYLGTMSQTFGWLRPWGRERLGDIREFKKKCCDLGLKANIPSRPFWSCTCSGKARGHKECTIWVNRTTRELGNKTTGSCTPCREHFLKWRADEFKRSVQRAENGHLPLSDLDLRQRTKWTKASLFEARSRVRRLPKYQQLGMCEEWKSPDTAAALAALVADIGLCPFEDYTLDRIDNIRGYFPGNVKWATKREQARNRSTSRLLEVDGHMQNLIDVAIGLGLKPSALSAQLARHIGAGMTESQALEVVMARRLG